MEPRIAIWARPRDAQLTSDFLSRHGFTCVTCQTMPEFHSQLVPETGAVVVAGELLSIDVLRRTAAVLEAQPPWSDLPFIVVSSSDSGASVEDFESLGNVSVLQRPLSLPTLRSTVRTALRARRRQFEICNLLKQKDEADRRKDEFLAMLAHELRNPLAPMRTGLRLLQLNASPDVLTRVQAMMDRQLTNLARLVDDLLDVSRLTRRTIVVKRRRLDIRESVRQAAEALERQAQDKGLTIDTRMPDRPLIVEADRVRLEQMVGNVVGNAVKYTPTDGHISISADAEDGWVVIRVRDTGLGIAPADLGRVFDLFAQTDRALDRSQGGLGIGLTVVRMLAELHGGLAEIFSEGEGKGTEVVIRLPKAEAIDREETAPPMCAPGVQSRRVLLIEDNKDSAEMLALFLEQAGHDVLVADRGDTGISAALRHRPDIVICDIGLPGCDGYEVARRLRNEPSLRSCLLVAITGYGEVADQERSKRAGFMYHLTKPADPAHVLELVTKPREGSAMS